MKVRIKQLHKNDDFYPVKDLLEGMIVEVNSEWKSDLKFNQEQCDFLQKTIPNSFKFKTYFKDPEQWVVFMNYDNLYSTNLDSKCKECGFKIDLKVCPNCGEWN